LSTLAAFRPASSGEVLLDGEPVFENPAAVRRICFIRGAGDTVEHDWPADRVRDALGVAGLLRPILMAFSRRDWHGGDRLPPVGTGVLV
jgi:ABC-2 type transport system ATP-binding protein